ncbi:MAG: hypothetical protein IPM29_15200 [Planctomycetes bacterium]|nr:hypothetical protein [Planctomycetota bacterium]
MFRDPIYHFAIALVAAAACSGTAAAQSSGYSVVDDVGQHEADQAFVFNRAEARLRLSRWAEGSYGELSCSLSTAPIKFLRGPFGLRIALSGYQLMTAGGGWVPARGGLLTVDSGGLRMFTGSYAQPNRHGYRYQLRTEVFAQNLNVTRIPNSSLSDRHRAEFMFVESIDVDATIVWGGTDLVAAARASTAVNGFNVNNGDLFGWRVTSPAEQFASQNLVLSTTVRRDSIQGYADYTLGASDLRIKLEERFFGAVVHTHWLQNFQSPQIVRRLAYL